MCVGRSASFQGARSASCSCVVDLLLMGAARGGARPTDTTPVTVVNFDGTLWMWRVKESYGLGALEARISSLEGFRAAVAGGSDSVPHAASGFRAAWHSAPRAPRPAAWLRAAARGRAALSSLLALVDALEQRRRGRRRTRPPRNEDGAAGRARERAASPRGPAEAQPRSSEEPSWREENEGVRKRTEVGLFACMR